MKPNQSNGKLQLKKQVVSNLSSKELEKVNAGVAEFTTSAGSCTGFLCCSPTHTCTIIEITKTITPTLITLL